VGYLFNSWNCKTLEELIDDKTIGLVKGAREQDNNFAYDYVKMHNISNQNSWNPFKIAKVNATESEIEKFRLRDDDLLFNTRNSFELVGKSCLFKSTSNNPVLFNNNIMRIRFGPDIDQRFAAYAFCSPDVLRQLEEMKQGTTNVSAIYFKTLKTLKIRFPPIAEQLYIVAILDQVFADIEKARATAETNLKNAHELFDSYLRQVFSQRGEGWKNKKWAEILEIKNGKNQRAVESSAGKYPIIGSAGKVMAYADDYICDEGTTIIGRKGTINNPIFIDTKFWNVDTAFGLQASDRLDKKFLYYFCLNYDFTTRDKGSGRPSLVKSDLLTVEMPVPEINEQRRLVSEIERLNSLLAEVFSIYEKKLDCLDELKKSILNKAFTGELTKSKGIAA
tara:strand:+ start:9621 stop:10796 length:1176 start_codon:yes stop_codon:yes gene_type:complete